MALVQGTPSIRLEGDRERALALIPEAQLLLAKAQSVTQRADVPTYSMNRRVSDDEYIYVLQYGEQSVIHISAGAVHPDVVYNAPELPPYTQFPNFLSGIVSDGRMDTRTETRPDGSTVTYKVMRQWAPTPGCAAERKLPTGRQSSLRLAVSPHSSMTPEWAAPPFVTNFEYSQYMVPRTSMWSGTMKKVVQIVFGFGHIRKSMLRDPKAPTTPSTQYMKDVDHLGVQVQYDYKFMRTHGIYRGPDNVLWLIEISASRGVLAMPLPIFPGSSGVNFLLRAEQRGDKALQTALEDLGCLPTGEGFPAGATLQAKLDRGDILRLLSAGDLQEFYRLSGYSSVCGWAFSENGHEAHNVGYTYPGDDVFQKGYWYQININIGAVIKKRRPGEPIALGFANLRKQSEGYLYSPPVKFSYIPVKYYEPLLPEPGLLSHSAKPLGPSTKAIECDTVVFVAFMNGALKTARYFKPKKADSQGSSFDDRIGETCLLDGSWSWRTAGPRSLPAMPYTNDIDNRSLLYESVDEGTLTSGTLGYDPPRYSDFIQAPDGCVVTKAKVWKQTTVTEQRGGESRGACFVVPAYSREAYYYFDGHLYDGGRKGSTSVNYVSVLSPYIYYGYRKFPRIYIIPYPPGCDCRTDKCGGKHTERRIVCFEYSRHQCYDYADGGPWAEQCQDIESLCAGKAPIRKPTSVSWDKGTDFKGTWNFYSDGLNGAASGETTEQQHAYAMAPSPDPETNLVQFIAAEHSAIGGECVLYTKGFNGEQVVTGYTPVPLGAHEMPLFIGVNQP
jgi:hypothetical protein